MYDTNCEVVNRRLFYLSPALIAVLILIAARPATAFSGTVVSIQDGDTLTVLTPTKSQFRIRLAGIDAPEYNQAFGTRSKQNLARLVFGKNVNLDCGKDESYGRLVCKILLPSGEDVCLDQIATGLAWHYKQFENEQTPQDRKLYAAAEDAARAAHIGLWADPYPVAPWDFRHGTQTRLCFDLAGHRVDCYTSGPVRGNRHSHVYHWPGCPYYEAISRYNRVDFPSAQAAEEAGYRPARNCR